MRNKVSWLITFVCVLVTLSSKAQAREIKEVHFLNFPEETEEESIKNESTDTNYLHTYYISDTNETEQLELIRATCYLPTGNPTASGVYPYEGIIASNRAHLGQVAALYSIDMEFIGYFECKDTGGHIGLKNGTRIDVYRESKERLKEWINTYGDYVYIKWIDANQCGDHYFGY